MKIKTIITSIIAATAALSPVLPVWAQTSGYCFDTAMNGDKIDPPMCGTASASNGGSGENINWAHHYPPVAVAAPVAPVPPVVAPIAVVPEEPVGPTEPTPGIHPDHPEGNGTEVDLNLANFVLPAGTYTQIFAPASEAYGFPGGVIDAVVRPDGTATVWVISVGLPGQPL